MSPAIMRAPSPAISPLTLRLGGSEEERRRAEAAILRRGWLTGQPAALRDAVLAKAELRRYAAGQVVFRADDPPGGIYGVVSGGFALSVAVPPAALALAHIMREGTWFGHGPLLLGGRRHIEVRASEPAEALRVPLASLEEIATDIPLAQRSLGAIGELAVWVAMQVVADLLIPRPKRRLAAVLLRVTGAAEGTQPPVRPGTPSKGVQLSVCLRMRRAAHSEVRHRPAPPPGHPFQDTDVGGRVGERAGAGLIKQTLSQTDLAQMANVSRQFANRALGGFVRHGWATVGYGCVAVTDVDALSAFAFGTVGAAALP